MDAIGGSQLEVLGDLHAELAGGHDDEGLNAGLRVQAEGLDQREAEAEGLAGSRLGLTDDVLGGEAERDGLGLDGEGLEDALRSEGVDHVLVDVEIGESHRKPV